MISRYLSEVPPGSLGHFPELGSVALTFRWAVVVSSLLVAYLSGFDHPILARYAAFGPILASIAISALSYRHPASRWLWFALVMDIVVGTGCVLLTGGAGSPFLAYLSVPLVRSAVHLWVAPLTLGSLVALVALAVIHVVDDDRPIMLFLAANEIVVILGAPWLVFAILHRVRGLSASADRSISRQWKSELSADDLELVDLLRTGATYAQIAESISLSMETVKVRVARLYRRLGARNRTEAIAVVDSVESHLGAPRADSD